MEFTMYQLSEEINKVKNLAYNDEITDEEFADTFESLQVAVEDKAESVGYVVSMLEADVEKCKAEKQHIADVQKHLENRAKRIKESLMNLMVQSELKEIKGGRFNCKICTAGGVQKLSEYNVNEVPEKYMKVEILPDEKKMREDLDKGEELGFVHYEPRTQYLKVK